MGSSVLLFTEEESMEEVMVERKVNVNKSTLSINMSFTGQLEEEPAEPQSLMTKALDEVKLVLLCFLQQIDVFYRPYIPKSGPDSINLLIDLKEDLIRISQEIFFSQENNYLNQMLLILVRVDS